MLKGRCAEFLSTMTRVLVSLLALAASFVATLSELPYNLRVIFIHRPIQVECFDKYRA
jgi:hypothetical protein